MPHACCAARSMCASRASIRTGTVCFLSPNRNNISYWNPPKRGATPSMAMGNMWAAVTHRPERAPDIITFLSLSLSLPDCLSRPMTSDGERVITHS